MKILVTGGLGYIGSHTVLELVKNNEDVVIVDNLYNSKIETLDKLKKLTNKDLIFYQGDVCNKSFLEEVFEKEEIDAVIHFAGYKAVGESVNEPLKYYRNNLDTTLTLLEVMKKYGVYNIVFSSSATVYGDPKKLPSREDFTLQGTSPYARTKIFIEEILKDCYEADNNWNITILRYFNPIGSEKSGLIGEDNKGIPNNLMPYILKVANKELPYVNIFGNDYNTVDGTGVRDYIHILDLARGHVLALKSEEKGYKVYNLGTGKGTSVLELIHSFEKVNHIEINKKFAPRRSGDVDIMYADTKKAYEHLGFKTEYDIDDMCRDAYNYAKKEE